jgi:hypothetical protein
MSFDMNPMDDVPADREEYEKHEREQEIAALKQQRDDLLLALKLMVRSYAQEYLLRSELGMGDEEIELGKASAERAADEAIAKVEKRTAPLPA